MSRRPAPRPTPPPTDGPVVVAGVVLTPAEVTALPPRLAALVRRRLTADPDGGVPEPRRQSDLGGTGGRR